MKLFTLKNKLVHLAIATLALSSITAYSQATEDLLDMSMEDLLNTEITVASSKATNIFNTPSTVTVIDQQTISQYNFQTVAEAVQTVAGLSVYRTYLKRNLPTTRGIVQEHYANKTLVLINGIAAWNAVTGEGNLERININDVERIEVLKGPASVLYGTNAYSGAINIVLKSAKENTEVEGHAGIGTAFSGFAGANVKAKSEDFSFFASANNMNITSPTLKFKGEDNKETVYNEFLKTQTFTMTTGYKGHQLLFNSFAGAESFLGVAPAIGYANGLGGAGNSHDLKGVLAAYNYKGNITDNLSVNGGAYYDYGFRELSRTKSDSVRSQIQGYSTGVNLGASVKVASYLTIDAGGDFDYRISEKYNNYLPYKDTATQENNMKNKDITENSYFVQAMFNLDKFQAVAGTRYTNHSVFGDNFSSRATLVYAFNSKNSLKLMYGESFRAPAIFEQYFTASTVYGNPNLKPETSKSIELAYLTSFDNFFIQALVYHGIYENKIYRSKDSTLTRADGKINTTKSSVYDNGKTFTANGLELEVKYNNPKIINLFVNYAFVKGDQGDKVEGTEIYNFKYVPEQTIAAGISKSFFKYFNISGVYNYMSEMAGPWSGISAQQTIDANLSVKHKMFNANMEHVFSVKNVTDSDMMFPEYARNKPDQINQVNEVPYGYPRFMSYTLKVNL